MLERNNLIRPTEQHFMIAHNAAAAYRAYAKLHRVALLAHRRAVIYIVVSAVIFLVDGIRQHKGSAAGGIQLVVVMLLDNLHIVAGAKDGRSALAQLGKNIYAHGHVCALEHRHCGGKLHNPQLQILRQAGGADNSWELVCRTVGQKVLYCRRGAEVYHNIAAAGQLFGAVIHRDAVLLAVGDIQPGDNAAVSALGNHVAQHMAHAPADALNDNIRHFYRPFFFVEPLIKSRQTS